MMTKKVYESVAQAVYRSFDPTGGCAQPGALVDNLSVIFTKDNPRFDHAKFREACLTGKHIRKRIREN